MIFFRNKAKSPVPMAKENLADRLDRLCKEAVKAGRFRSRNEILTLAGVSNGYFSDLRSRLARNGDATITHATATSFAKALNCEVWQLLEGQDEDSADVDPYPDRYWAVTAARALQYPEEAIQAVLSEAPPRDPGRLYWFRRIEAEREGLRPAADSVG